METGSTGYKTTGACTISLSPHFREFQSLGINFLRHEALFAVVINYLGLEKKKRKIKPKQMRSPTSNIHISFISFKTSDFRNFLHEFYFST